MDDGGRDSRFRIVTLENTIGLPLYIARGLRYYAAGRIYTPKPKYAGLRVTRRSDWDLNARGDGKELSLTEIKQILGNRLFNSVDKFVLGGGEATLREDITDIAETVFHSCPGLKEMLLRTYGLEPARVAGKVKELMELPGYGGLRRFAVSISLNVYGDSCENAIKYPQTLDRVRETVVRLTELQQKSPFYIGAVFLVHPGNVRDVIPVDRFGSEMNLPVNFIPADLGYSVGGSNKEARITLNEWKRSPDQLEKLKGILKQRSKEMLAPSLQPFWNEFFKIIDGGKRNLPCSLHRYHVGIESDGSLYMCIPSIPLFYGNALDEPLDKIWYSDKAKEVRKTVRQDCCPRCIDCSDMAYTLRQEFFYYARFIIGEKGKRLLGAAQPWSGPTEVN